MNESQFKELCAMTKHEVFSKYSRMLMHKLITKQQYESIWKLWDENNIHKMAGQALQLSVAPQVKENGFYSEENQIDNLVLMFGKGVEATSTVLSIGEPPF